MIPSQVRSFFVCKVWFSNPFDISNVLSSELVGCYNGSGVVKLVQDSPDMTIQLCVETCRHMSLKYALLQPTGCGCQGFVPTEKLSGSCVSGCSGQYNQICGGEGPAMSVYDVGMRSCSMFTNAQCFHYPAVILQI